MQNNSYSIKTQKYTIYWKRTKKRYTGQVIDRMASGNPILKETFVFFVKTLADQNNL